MDALLYPLPTPCLRPARASDGDAVGAFLDGLSAHSRYLRFHGACSGASPSLRRLLCDVDGSFHQAWLAWVGEGDAASVVGELYAEVMDSNGRMQAFMRRHRFDTVRCGRGEVIRMSRDLRQSLAPCSNAPRRPVVDACRGGNP